MSANLDGSECRGIERRRRRKKKKEEKKKNKQGKGNEMTCYSTESVLVSVGYFFGLQLSTMGRAPKSMESGEQQFWGRYKLLVYRSNLQISGGFLFSSSFF
jgi:hypothetical protein